jgi:hypothetical protein
LLLAEVLVVCVVLVVVLPVVVLLLVDVRVDEVEVVVAVEAVLLVLLSDPVTKASAAPAPIARTTHAKPIISIHFQGYGPEGGLGGGRIVGGGLSLPSVPPAADPDCSPAPSSTASIFTVSPSEG